MTTQKNGDTFFVYDRYYSSKPNVLLQSLKRILLCGGITVFPVLFLLTEYKLPVNPGYAAAVSGLFSLGFSVLFIFVRKRFAVPAIAVIAGIIALFGRKALWVRLSYFVDAILLSIDGRLVDMKQYLWHSAAVLTENNADYVSGVTLGFTLVCLIFALITSASMFRKPRILSSMLVFVLLWSPRMMAEQLELNFWLFPAIGLYAGAAALSISYREGIAIRHGGQRNVSEEKAFSQKASKAPFFKRAKMNEIHYSKYFSLALSAAAVFTASALLANVVLGSGGIDFSGMYNFFGSIGGGGITSPFEEGPVSEYFSGTGINAGSQGSGLGISSPGQGEQEILRVTNTGFMPVYLRGDVGVDFKGNSWTSPVTYTSALWQDKELSENYRPAELRVLRSMAGNFYENPDEIITDASVTVDYLCRTDVVFLPAYTMDFGYYENEMFNVYRDFVVRVDDSYDTINTVKCKALIPLYTYTGSKDRARGTSAISDLENVPMLENFGTVLDTFLSGNGIMEKYSQYVNSTYTGVPENMKDELYVFLQENDLIEDVTQQPSYTSAISRNYHIAMKISDFLQENYTYSLTVKNDTNNPVMSFLNETKSGHCALYASAMTLLMRRLGIPARYCTGFVAKPNATGEVLRAKHLHAWCEVYLESVGWVTFDPTSASLNGTANGEPTSSDSESSYSEPESSSQAESSDSVREESSESSSLPGGTGDNTTVDESEAGIDTDKPDILPYLLIMAGIVIILIAAVLLIMRYNQLDKYARKRIRNMRNGEAAYSKILAVLSLFGIRPKNGELPGEFYKRACAFLDLNPEEYYDILERAAFGKISAEDAPKLSRLLERVFSAADKQAKGLKKLKLRKLILRKDGRND